MEGVMTRAKKRQMENMERTVVEKKIIITSVSIRKMKNVRVLLNRLSEEDLKKAGIHYKTIDNGDTGLVTKTQPYEYMLIYLFF